jgi:hypothetical protein
LSYQIDKPLDELLVQAHHSTLSDAFRANVLHSAWLQHWDVTLPFVLRDFFTQPHPLANHCDQSCIEAIKPRAAPLYCHPGIARPPTSR